MKVFAFKVFAFNKVGLLIFVLGWICVAAVSGHYTFSSQFLISYFFATAFYYLGLELDR